MSGSKLPAYSDQDSGAYSSTTDKKWDGKTQTTVTRERPGVQLPDHLEYTRDASGSIVCRDIILDDPVYFSAFIQHHGAKPPDLTLSIKGTHWEEYSTGPDRTDGNHVKETSRRVVTDFDLRIPLTREILIQRNGNVPPYFFTYKPEIPTYRNSTLKRRQNPQEEQERIDNGLSAGQNAIVQYLSSQRILKEFRFEKAVSGWDMKALEQQITVIIRRTGYAGTVKVNLIKNDAFIYIRPNNTFSNFYHHPVTQILRFVLFPIGLILLLLDYIWLGAYWQVLGAKFDLYSSDVAAGTDRGMSTDQFLIVFGQLIEQNAMSRRIGEVLSWPSEQGTSRVPPYRDLI